MTKANDSIHNSEQGPQDGLTKREYFAAMALQGLIARSPSVLNDEISKCVTWADLLIIALKENP